MKTVITYGTYDMLHYGHIALLERAKALGDRLIVGVTSDTFDRNRGKLNVKQSFVERIEGVRETGLADMIIAEEYEGQKIDDIQKYHVDVFTVGSDWEGHFDYLKDYCDVVYLKRTEGISSTELRKQANPILRFGVLGATGPVQRFADEIKFVSGAELTAAFHSDSDYLESYCNRNHVEACADYDDLISKVDVVYVSGDAQSRYDQVMQALSAGKHVICETPAFIDVVEAQNAIDLAHQKGLVLFEALKTMYFPAFERLKLLVRSGTVGAIRDIDVGCSIVPLDYSEVKKNRYRGAMYDWGAIALVPILKFLGTDYRKVTLYDFQDDGFGCFAKGTFEYEHATATFRAGVGVKTEGDLVITGTKGYVYVPAPWWKTDFFEVRSENLSDTRKYYYQFAGEGLRYEILEFVDLVHSGGMESYKRPNKEIIETARIIERYHTGDVARL